MMMQVVMMLVPVVLLLLPERKPRRAVVKVQEGNDNGQEGGKSEANDEANLDVVVLGGVIRELSLDIRRWVLASTTA